MFAKRNDKGCEYNNSGRKFLDNGSKKNSLSIKKIILALSSFLRNIRIQTRLIIAFLMLSLIPIVVIEAVSYTISSNSLTNKISTYSSEIVSQVGTNIKTRIDTYESIIQELSFSRDVQEGMDKYLKMSNIDKFFFNDKINGLINSKLTLRKEIRAVEYYYNKTYLSGQSLTERGNKNKANIELFRLADEAKGRPVWKVMTYDEEGYQKSDKKVMALVKSIRSFSTGNEIGYVMMFIDIDYFVEMFKAIDIGEGSDVVLVDSLGTVLVDKNDPSSIGTPYKEQLLVSKAMKSEVFKIIIGGENQLVTSSMIPNTEWCLAAVIPQSFLGASSKAIGRANAIVMVIVMLISIILSYIITQSISVPLRKMVDMMEVAKEGDFSFAISDNKKDEISIVLSNFNDMVANISDLVSGVHHSTINVLASSKEISKLSEQTRYNSEQISNTMQEISNGSTQQALDISEGVEQMTSLSQSLNAVESSVNNMNQVVISTKQLSENALSAVKTLNDKALETSHVSLKIIDSVNSLDNDMKEIKNIVKVLVGITEQTKLLSLNATIEAARAGQAGAGFAVVADEVKKLAGKSKAASSTIISILGEIAKKTENTVMDANGAREIIDKQMDAVAQTDMSFKTILTSMEGIGMQLANVEKSLDVVIATRNKTIATIDSVSAVSQEAAATTEEVSASTEEQIISAETLASLAANLERMAERLSESISIFKF